jgi:transcriptional regulator with XRE-family HTH domain
MASFQQAFGAAVRRRRHKLGLSQEDFAEHAEIHRTYISKIEAGKVDVGLAAACRLARALGVELNKLIAEAERA